MEPQRLEQVERVYQAAVERQSEALEVVLDRECGDDVELRREVESLLSYEGRAASFLDEPPARLAAQVFAATTGEYYTGDKINRYTIEKLLGEGGMGQVYLAADERLKRKVALKIFPASIADDPEALMRFEREAQAASALNHPNILTVYEFGEQSGVHFIATEFVDGITLRTRLIADRPSVDESFEIVSQVLSALAAAHQAGITHRDIKPENIMIRRDGYVKVLDFGLAKLVQPMGVGHTTDSGSEDPTAALQQTKPGAVMGTAPYMSPEQLRGVNVDFRTDIWSLAVVLYEIIAGERPFRGETHADVLVAVLGADPAPISGLLPGIPTDLDAIIRKALAKKADDRYRTAGEFKNEIDRMRKEAASGPTTLGGDVDGAGAETGRNRGSVHGTAEPARTDIDPPRPTDGGTAKTEEGTPSLPTAFKWLGIAASQRTSALAVLGILIAAIVGVAGFLALSRPSSNVIDSIAVLPFDNSGDPELQAISDGLSEGLIDRFAQLPQLKVISKSSSFKFRGPDIDISSAATQLNARAIVTGKVSRQGNDLLIRVDIIDAVENRQLAGGQYRRIGGDMLGLQSEIAQNALEKFKLRLTDDQSRRIAQRITDNSESYRYYLNGMLALNGLDTGRQKALEYFNKAIELDPEFAPAHAEIAEIYWMQANAQSDPAKIMPLARDSADRALELDPEFARAHVVRAMVYEYEFNWAKAESEYREAIDLSPNLDSARNNYAMFLSVMDRHDEALAQLEEQRIRDPLNMRMLLLQKGIVLVQARQFDDAIKAYQEAQAVDPTEAVPEFALGYAYGGKQMSNEAIKYYSKAISDLGGDQKYSQPLIYLAAVYAGMPGKRTEARAILTRIEGMDEYVSPAILAIIHTALDENDKAIELLERAYMRRDPLLRFIRTGYEYDRLRSDPRFVDIERRTGLVR